MKKSISILFIVFYLQVNAQYTKLFDFAGVPAGRSPYASLFYDGTFLYGSTIQGGVSDSGIIYKIKPDGTGYTKLFDFTGPNGSSPQATLISDGTFLYGTTYSGGAYNVGVVYKIKPDGSGFTKLLDFNGTNGSQAYGALFYDGTFLYGMASGNSTNYNSVNTGYGVIYRLKPDGSGDTVLFQFNGASGNKPSGSLISDGTYLYGMAMQGGSSSFCSYPDGCGTIFKIKPDGSGFTKLHDFNGPSGSLPTGSLLFIGDTLYGVTEDGGTYHGVVFSLKTDGTAFTVLHNFIAGQGVYPVCSLVYDSTYLYGTTLDGGANYSGSIFRIKPDGTGGVDLFDNFTYTNGTFPIGALVYDGTCFYGITGSGGIKDSGVIYKFCAGTYGINKFTQKNQPAIYPNPAGSKIVIEANYTADVKLFDITGKQLLQQTVTGTTTIDVSQLENGVYFIQLKSGEGVSTQKLIVQH